MKSEAPQQSSVSIGEKGLAVGPLCTSVQRAAEMLGRCMDSDLQLLAATHDTLGEVSNDAVKSLSADRASPVCQTATSAMQLIEQVVLKEADNLDAALRQAAAIIIEIQAVLSGSSKAEKEIEFVVQGGETELDRNIVEAISDRRNPEIGGEDSEDYQGDRRDRIPDESFGVECGGGSGACG